jgi:hypothetical protein
MKKREKRDLDFVDLVRGRTLAPDETWRLIKLVDRLLDMPAINSARHRNDKVYLILCEIEEFLTGAGYYATVERCKDGGEHDFAMIYNDGWNCLNCNAPNRSETPPRIGGK